MSIQNSSAKSKRTVYLRLQFATGGVGVLTLVRGLQCLAVCHDQQMISTAPTS